MSLSDVSLWLAVTALILLATSELLSPYFVRINLKVNKRYLRAAAVLTSILFMFAVIMQTYLAIP